MSEMNHPATIRKLVAESLLEEIKKSHAAVLSLVEDTREKARNSILEAVRCGHLLAKAKTDAGHGHWLPWLKANCPDICEKTAQNYMRLANAKHVADLENAAGLRQAYILAGIIDEADAHIGRSGSSVAQVVERLAAPIGRVRQWFAVRMQRMPIEHWSQEERKLTKQQLQPLVELYQKL